MYVDLNNLLNYKANIYTYNRSTVNAYLQDQSQTFSCSEADGWHGAYSLL